MCWTSLLIPTLLRRRFWRFSALEPGSSGTPFLHFLFFLSQRRLRTSDKNFENILFANANFEVFDAELRKRKQPERDDDDEWFSKVVTNSSFVLQKRRIF